MKILLTGSTGFVGSVLNDSLAENYEIVSVVRQTVTDFEGDFFSVEEFNESTDFSNALIGVDIVIHLAARAHVTKENIIEPLAEFRKINTEATLQLARQAVQSGASRFIFISSIGVNGKANNTPFFAHDNPNPVEDYAISKYEAEIGLKKIAEGTDMNVVIIRPPLVYGKNAPGNFGTLMKVAEKNLPLPLGAINNQRSFVAIDNLIDLIATCIEHPNAANQTFLVSDDENVSTSTFLKKLTVAAGKKPWLLPVPVSFLKFTASIFGKKAAVERFSSSLTVDIKHTMNTLNWKPPITLDEGIRRCFK